MSDKLDIFDILRQIDSKNRNYYRDLPEEDKKKVVPFVLNRWVSAVQGPFELQDFYLYRCNDCINKHFFELYKYPELQWLSLTAISPGMGTHRHEWIKQKPRVNNNKVIKFLRSFYPSYTDDDLETLAAITTTDELKQLAKDHGWTDKDIKGALK